MAKKKKSSEKASEAKVEEKDLKAKIKEMENKKREAAPVSVKVDKKVSFDSWFHQRKTRIPRQHMKEIIAADFKSRGLGKEATMEEFDKALKLYGIEL
jgi:hypothetical protein